MTTWAHLHLFSFTLNVSIFQLECSENSHFKCILGSGEMAQQLRSGPASFRGLEFGLQHPHQVAHILPASWALALLCTNPLYGCSRVLSFMFLSSFVLCLFLIQYLQNYSLYLLAYVILFWNFSGYSRTCHTCYQIFYIAFQLIPYFL